MIYSSRSLWNFMDCQWQQLQIKMWSSETIFGKLCRVGIFFVSILWGKLGNKLLFFTTCHLQTNGKTEIVNRTLTTLLHSIIQKNLRSRERCLSHIEFAYYMNVPSMTNSSLFEVIYVFNPLTPLNLIPLPFEK